MLSRSETKFKLQFTAAKLKQLAAAYAEESDNEAFAAGRRIASGKFDPSDLIAIFKWKTKGRGISRIKRNSDSEIMDAIRLATAAKTDRTAIAVLRGLQGVDIPVASAILTVIDPQKFTVIDFRALEALGIKKPSLSLEFYLKYLAHCRNLSDQHGISLRNLDRALWKWSKLQSPKARSKAAKR